MVLPFPFDAQVLPGVALLPETGSEQQGTARGVVRQASGLDPKHMTPLELARLSPPQVSNPSDNLKNLFELPAVFYAVVLYIYATGQVDAAYVGAAWGFFLFRALHSAVHCTFNFIPLRFALYVISAGALWFMVLRAALAAIW